MLSWRSGVLISPQHRLSELDDDILYSDSFKVFPALNFTVLLALILRAAPVCGLRPVLAFLFANEKDPNPTMITLPSFLQVFATASTNDAMAAFACVFVMPASAEILSTSSDLIMEPPEKFCHE